MMITRRGCRGFSSSGSSRRKRANKKGDGNGRAVRLADQAEFIGRLMFEFNSEIAHYLREELGCRQLINAGNWRTADQVILDDVERWSYTANDVIGKNHYFAGLHNGLNVGWQVLPGQTFTSKSFTTNPYIAPLSVRQVVGRPFIVPESLWVPPNPYRAEGPMIVAAQSCLTGLDVFFWFNTNALEWQPPGVTGMKWTFAEPMTLGQFPAAALLFRMGYVREGPSSSTKSVACKTSGIDVCHSWPRGVRGTPTGTRGTCRKARRSKPESTRLPIWSAAPRLCTTAIRRRARSSI